MTPPEWYLPRWTLPVGFDDGTGEKKEARSPNVTVTPLAVRTQLPSGCVVIKPRGWSR